MFAREWAFSGRVLKRFDHLAESDLFKLHKRMFGDTWKWAGKTRVRNKNIGVPFHQIRVELRKLIDDARYWRDEKAFDVSEIAVRFHHRLVKIHLFPNGNGRHARFVADIIAKQAGAPGFTWGGGNLTDETVIRSDYIAALKMADNGHYTNLITFSRA